MTTLVLEHLQHADSASPDITIDSSGRIGIGTTGPGTTLHVYNSTVNGVATFESGDAQGGIALKDNSTTQPVYLLADGNDFKVQTNTAEVMRIHSEGYTELKSSDAYNQLVLTPSGTNAPASINFNTPGTGRAKIKVQDAEFISILSTGNVGIGTTSPTAKLSVDQPSTTAISTTGSAAAGQIFTNEDFEFAFGLSNASPYPLYIQGRTSNPGISTPRNITLNPIGGNISIGTQSAIDRLHVETASTQAHSTTLTKGTNTPGIWITNSNNDNVTSGLHLATGSGTHFSSIIGARTSNAAHWGTHLSFYTHDDNTSNLNTATEKMRISGNGIVTKPQQPSFSAHKTSHLVLSGAGSIEAGTWSDSWMNGAHNTGGHFNTTTGRFTVPIDGRYKFDANIMHGNTSGDYQVWICVNGNTSTAVKSNDMTSTGGSWKQTTLTGIFNLAANDYISIFIRSSTAESYAIYGTATAAFTTCNGYLIG